MKVLVVFTFDYSLMTWEKSGTLEKELYIYKEIGKKENIEFIFLTYGDERDLSLVDESIKTVPVYKYFKFSKNRFLRYLHSFLLPIKLRKQIGSFDLIKQNQLLGSWTSIIFKLLYRKPLFIRTGYDMYKFSVYEKKKKYIQALYKFLTKFSIYFSDLYSVSSKTDFDFFNDSYKLQDKLILRPNWVTSNKNLELDSRNDHALLCVGRIEKQKNFEYLINEISKLNTFSIDLYGDGSCKDYLVALAKSKNVKLNIMGIISNDELKRIYNKYKFFINPSFYEGNPKTVLEAMSSGCIVFASNIDNHSEIIANGINGFLFDLAEGALTEVVNRLDQFDLNQISENAYKHTLNYNDTKIAVDIEINDYRELIKK